MKAIDYVEAKIPTWALPYLVNGDTSGLEDSEIAMVDEWWQESADALPDGAHLTFDYSGDEYFAWNTAFGLAATVEDCVLIAMVPNEDPRPDIGLPDWLENRDLENA